MAKKSKKSKKTIKPKVVKVKKVEDTKKSDVVTNQLDLNEPLRFNVKQSIKDDKKIKPQDVFD
jgi:hypothetical protein